METILIKIRLQVESDFSNFISVSKLTCFQVNNFSNICFQHNNYQKSWVGFTLVEMENDLTRDQEANFSEDKSGIQRHLGEDIIHVMMTHQ